jgi:cyclic pyranopterin phosphate synthase
VETPVPRDHFPIKSRKALVFAVSAGKHRDHPMLAKSSTGAFRVPSASLPLDGRGRPLRDLRISLTDHCNLRCVYCMPNDQFGPGHAFLPPDRLLSFEEITDVVRALADLGLRKVKLTGGEPLARTDLPRLIAMLAAAAPTVDLALITNGVLLAPLVSALKSAGLHRITISLDSLDNGRYNAISGRTDQLPNVLRGIDAALAAGFSPVKINMVVIRGLNDMEVPAMADFFHRPETILRFIEFMDAGTLNGWQRSKVVPSSELVARLHARAKLSPIDSPYPGETAERYRYVDGSGEIGFISSVTQPFCGDCNRLRLSADGKLFACLFAKEGFDLKPALRGNSRPPRLRETLATLWRQRRDQYSVDRADAPSRPKIEMFYIGG